MWRWSETDSDYNQVLLRAYHGDKDAHTIE